MRLMLDTFLGCFTLRRGCFFIGYSGAILSALSIISSFGGIIFCGQRLAYLTGEDQFANEMILGVCFIILIAASIVFSLYVVLLVALRQYRPTLMHTFLIGMTIYLVTTLVLATILTIILPDLGIRVVVLYAWNIYFMLVCNSYYYNMREEVSIQSGIKPV